MIFFLATGVSFAEKQQEYVLTLRILAQILVGYPFSMLAIYCKHKLCNTINQA
jgi:hypothetical protein